MKVRFSLSIGLSNAEQWDEVEFEDNATDEEIENAYTEWTYNYIDGGWEKIDE